MSILNMQFMQFSNIVLSNIDKFLLSLLFTILLLSNNYSLADSVEHIKDKKRFTISGINSKFTFDTSKSFEQYIEYTKDIVKKSRIDLDGRYNDKISIKQIIDWNSPFIFQPKTKCKNDKKKGVVLVHGLKASAYEIRDVGKYLQEQCFLVFGYTLVGHGTRPGDLLEVEYQDWEKQLEYVASQLSSRVDELYLGGVSLGAILAFNYAQIHGNVKGLMLFSPALVLPFKANFASMIKHIRPWYSQDMDIDALKYESLTINGVAQTLSLSKKFQSLIKTSKEKMKNTKLFAVIDYGDKIVNQKAGLNYLIQRIDENNRYILVYYRSDYLVPKKISQAKNIFVKNATLEKEKILGMSHVSLNISSENPWYGKNGKYRSCIFYQKQPEKFHVCTIAGDLYLGNVSDIGTENRLVRRITFNPFMQDMTNRLNKFMLQ